jgi:hypothetical protein
MVPTFWGTQDCTFVPEFSLLDLNVNSTSYTGGPYGIYYTEKTDVIIVQLLFADNPTSVENALMQEKLGEEIANAGYTVKNVIINYYAPLNCLLEGDCVNFWWTFFPFPGVDNCVGYTAGCPPGDSRLQFPVWQGLVTQQVDIPLFQDVAPGFVWDAFGGLNGDVFIYDREGRLFSYLCNIENLGAACTTPLVGGGLKDKNSYNTALSAAYNAAESDSMTRCGEDVLLSSAEDEVKAFSDAGTKIYYVDDYYYYNDFNNADDKKSGSPHVIPVGRRHTHHRVVHKVPTYVYASLVATIATVVTFSVLYYRWKKGKERERLGDYRFTQLPTEEKDKEQMEYVDNPFSAELRSASSDNDPGILPTYVPPGAKTIQTTEVNYGSI